MKLYNTVAEIDKACVAFHKKGQSLQTEAHKLACSVLKHVGEHGDIRVVAKFLLSFADMARVNAVRAWFEEFGPIAFDKNQPVHVKGKATKLGAAMETPFWKFKPEAPYEPLDVAKAIDGLVKKLVKDSEVTKADHSATIAALRAAPVSKVMLANVILPN